MKKIEIRELYQWERLYLLTAKISINGHQIKQKNSHKKTVKSGHQKYIVIDAWQTHIYKVRITSSGSYFDE